MIPTVIVSLGLGLAMYKDFAFWCSNCYIYPGYVTMLFFLLLFSSSGQLKSGSPLLQISSCLGLVLSAFLISRASVSFTYLCINDFTHPFLFLSMFLPSFKRSLRSSPRSKRKNCRRSCNNWDEAIRLCSRCLSTTDRPKDD